MSDTPHFLWRILAFSGLLWVILGAATGHEPLPAQAAVWFEKAQRYHIIHTLAGMVVCWSPCLGKARVILAWLAGTVLFSGSLYLMALTGLPLRYVVPFGGVAFIGGWLLLLMSGIKSRYS